MNLKKKLIKGTKNELYKRETITFIFIFSAFIKTI